MTSTTRCENNLEARIYFWNVTNPSEVLTGTHGPALREIGPYVLKNTINKRQNITFSNDDTEVSFVSTLYADADAESSCDGCALTDEVRLRKSTVDSMQLTVGPRRLFLLTWRTSAWFEQLVARRTFSPRRFHEPLQLSSTGSRNSSEASRVIRRSALRFQTSSSPHREARTRCARSLWSKYSPRVLSVGFR